MKAYKNPQITILNLAAEDVLAVSTEAPDIFTFGGENEAPAMSLLPY